MNNFKAGDIFKWGDRKDQWKVLIVRPLGADIQCVKADLKDRPQYHIGDVYHYIPLDDKNISKIKSSDSAHHPLTSIFK